MLGNSGKTQAERGVVLPRGHRERHTAITKRLREIGTAAGNLVVFREPLFDITDLVDTTLMTPFLELCVDPKVDHPVD